MIITVPQLAAPNCVVSTHLLAFGVEARVFEYIFEI
jgi:hypothetical protein